MYTLLYYVVHSVLLSLNKGHIYKYCTCTVQATLMNLCQSHGLKQDYRWILIKVYTKSEVKACWCSDENLTDTCCVWAKPNETKLSHSSSNHHHKGLLSLFRSRSGLDLVSLQCLEFGPGPGLRLADKWGLTKWSPLHSQEELWIFMRSSRWWYANDAAWIFMRVCGSLWTYTHLDLDHLGPRATTGNIRLIHEDRDRPGLVLIFTGPLTGPTTLSPSLIFFWSWSWS